MDTAVRQVVDEAGAIDREIASLTDRVVKLREQESDAYRQLARLRLKDLSDGELVLKLTAAEQQARRLLSERSQAVAELDQRLGELESELAAANVVRDQAAAEADAATAQLTEAEKAALDALAATGAYQELRAAAEKADAVAHHAEQKRDFAAKDLVEKGRPYADDALFMYLWRRGYGTAEYSSGSFVRYFDGRVARLIRYDHARANYSMLQEIPRRLAAHAERQRRQADEAAERLDKAEAEAVADGALAERRSQLDAAQKRRQSAEDTVEAIEEKRRSILEERATLTRGEDDRTRQALDVVLAAIQRQDLRSLREQALRTPLPEDDVVVERIADIEAAIRDIENQVSQRKQMQLDQQKRLQDMEHLRRDYRRGGFGGDAFDFRDLGTFSVLLNEMLRGGLSRDGIWDQMRQRHQPRIPAPGGWGRGGGGLGGGLGLPRFPGGFGGGGRSRPSGGGGFRTGGGF